MLKPCSSPNQRHTWEWRRNTTTRTQTLSTVHLTWRGVYRCASCAQTKFGQPREPEQLGLNLPTP